MASVSKADYRAVLDSLNAPTNAYQMAMEQQGNTANGQALAPGYVIDGLANEQHQGIDTTGWSQDQIDRLNEMQDPNTGALNSQNLLDAIKVGSGSSVYTAPVDSSKRDLTDKSQYTPMSVIQEVAQNGLDPTQGPGQYNMLSDAAYLNAGGGLKNQMIGNANNVSNWAQTTDYDELMDAGSLDAARTHTMNQYATGAITAEEAQERENAAFEQHYGSLEHSYKENEKGKSNVLDGESWVQTTITPTDYSSLTPEQAFLQAEHHNNIDSEFVSVEGLGGQLFKMAVTGALTAGVGAALAPTMVGLSAGAQGAINGGLNSAIGGVVSGNGLDIKDIGVGALTGGVGGSLSNADGMLGGFIDTGSNLADDAIKGAITGGIGGAIDGDVLGGALTGGVSGAGMNLLEQGVDWAGDKINGFKDGLTDPGEFDFASGSEWDLDDKLNLDQQAADYLDSLEFVGPSANNAGYNPDTHIPIDDPRYDAQLDFDSDGVIDADDLQEVTVDAGRIKPDLLNPDGTINDYDGFFSPPTNTTNPDLFTSEFYDERFGSMSDEQLIDQAGMLGIEVNTDENGNLFVVSGDDTGGLDDYLTQRNGELTSVTGQTNYGNGVFEYNDQPFTVGQADDDSYFIMSDGKYKGISQADHDVLYQMEVDAISSGDWSAYENKLTELGITDGGNIYGGTNQWGAPSPNMSEEVDDWLTMDEGPDTSDAVQTNFTEYEEDVVDPVEQQQQQEDASESDPVNNTDKDLDTGKVGEGQTGTPSESVDTAVGTIVAELQQEQLQAILSQNPALAQEIAEQIADVIAQNQAETEATSETETETETENEAEAESESESESESETTKESESETETTEESETETGSTPTNNDPSPTENNATPGATISDQIAELIASIKAAGGGAVGGGGGGGSVDGGDSASGDPNGTPGGQNTNENGGGGLTDGDATGDGDDTGTGVQTGDGTGTGDDGDKGGDGEGAGDPGIGAGFGGLLAGLGAGAGAGGSGDRPIWSALDAITRLPGYKKASKAQQASINEGLMQAAKAARRIA